MDRKKLAERLDGVSSFRFKQILENVYALKASSWDDMTNLPVKLREELSDIPFLTLSVKKQVVSNDGTVKTLFACNLDGALVEAVMIPNKTFRTVCVSSQVGCAMACTFCATGTLGLTRNLTADEIADQVLFYSQFLATKGEKVTNVVYMGMGEPLANVNEVLKSVDILNEPKGINLGARKISISTSGLINGIKSIIEYPKQINLAISIHSADDKLRSEIMPVNRRFPLLKLLEVCKEYIEKTKRRLMFEYVMLDGVNDNLDQAKLIGQFLKPLSPLVVLNLIPFHQTFLSYSSSKKTQILAFQKVVQEQGIDCLIRHSAGVDIDAACGQLARTAY